MIKTMQWMMLASALTGCAGVLPNGDTLQLSAVSTEPKFVAPSTPGRKLGEADEKYCGDDVGAFTRVGYVDRLVSQAMKKANADYIANAKFHYVDSKCVEMTGDLMSRENVAASDLKTVPGLEVVGLNGDTIEIANPQGALLTPDQTFEIIDSTGKPQGELQIQKVDKSGIWAKLKSGKSFYGWRLAVKTDPASLIPASASDKETPPDDP